MEMRWPPLHHHYRTRHHTLVKKTKKKTFLIFFSLFPLPSFLLISFIIIIFLIFILHAAACVTNFLHICFPQRCLIVSLLAWWFFSGYLDGPGTTSACLQLGLGWGKHRSALEIYVYSTSRLIIFILLFVCFFSAFFCFFFLLLFFSFSVCPFFFINYSFLLFICFTLSSSPFLLVFFLATCTWFLCLLLLLFTFW